MQSVAGCLAQLIGPTSQMIKNSKFFSGVAPPRISRNELPHVTIQCPVYKEGLYSVIDPTMRSVRAAIATYEMQGGSANIFVNDDGMQLIAPEDAQARRDYYDEHKIGWVARPKHNPKPKDGEEAFIRAGKFKKASNMNYAMAVSGRVEDKLRQVVRGPGWTQTAETEAYQRCLRAVMEEDQGRTWADGNVRIGDYILLIDSDTRVPEDCFLDAVSEMEQSPQVAILQFSSGVMNVTTSFFENGITFFTWPRSLDTMLSCGGRRCKIFRTTLTMAPRSFGQRQPCLRISTWHSASSVPAISSASVPIPGMASKKEFP